LAATPWVAALLSAIGLGMALWSVQLQRRRATAPLACTQMG
ncbi:MFS transporter, partial [Xanthomonas perforans]